MKPSKPIVTIPSDDDRTVTAELLKAAEKERDDVQDWVDQIESDPQFAYAYVILSSLIQNSQFDIRATKGGPVGKAIADHTKKEFRRILPQAVRAIAHGRAAFEKQFETKQHRKTGREVVLLRKLIYIEPKFSKYCLDEKTGRFRGFKVKVGKGKDDVLVEPENAWWLAIDPTNEQPYGRSRYRGAAFRVWRKRKDLWDQRQNWRRRFAGGVGKAWAPSELPQGGKLSTDGEFGDIDSSGNPINPMSWMAETLGKVRGGGWVILPSDHTTATDGSANGQRLFDIEFGRIDANAAPLENETKETDIEVLHAMGIPELPVMQSGVGSYAMAEVQTAILKSTVMGLLSQICDSFQKYVLDKIAEMNSTKDLRIKLEITYQFLDPGLMAMIMDVVRSILQGNLPPIVSEGVDIEELFAIVGFPATENLGKAIAKMKQQAAMAEQMQMMQMMGGGMGGGEPPPEEGPPLEEQPPTEGEQPPAEEPVQMSLSKKIKPLTKAAKRMPQRVRRKVRSVYDRLFDVLKDRNAVLSGSARPRMEILLKDLAKTREQGFKAAYLAGQAQMASRDAKEQQQ